MQTTLATDINIAIEVLNELIEKDYSIELSQAAYSFIEVLKENLKTQGEELLYEDKDREAIIRRTIQIVNITAVADKSKYPGLEKFAKIITDELYKILNSQMKGR